MAVTALPRARQAIVERTGEQPMRADLAAELGISKTTLTRYLRNWADR